MSSPFGNVWAMLKAQPEHQLTLPSELPPSARMGSPSEGRQFYNIGGVHRQFGTMDPNVRAMAERNEVPLDKVRRQPVEYEPETAKVHGMSEPLFEEEDDGNPGSLFGEQEIFHETPASRQMGGQKDVKQRTYGTLRDYPVETRKMLKGAPFGKAWTVLKMYNTPMRDPEDMPIPFNVSPTPNPTWWKTHPAFARSVGAPNQRSQFLGAGSEGGINTEEGFEPEYQGEVMPNPEADALDYERNIDHQRVKVQGMLQGLQGEELEQFIMEQMQQHHLAKGQPFDKSWNFLKLDPTKNPQHPNAPHDTSAGQHEEAARAAQEQADLDASLFEYKEKYLPNEYVPGEWNHGDKEMRNPPRNIPLGQFDEYPMDYEPPFPEALTAQEQADEDIVQEKFDPYKAMTDAGYLPKDIDWLFPPGPDPETPEDTERLSREP